MTAPRRHFVFVGAQRSGTSFLTRHLDGHPAIAMARPLWPEPKFFLLPECVEGGLGAYSAYFAHAGESAELLGEKSTSYLESPQAADAIGRLLPDAKVLVVLRDPVERAISNYRFSVRNGLERAPFAVAVRQERKRRERYDRRSVSVSPFAYLRRGRYADHLALWERRLPRSHIGVFLLEQLVAESRSRAAMFSFIGVDPALASPLESEPINVGEGPLVEVDEGLREEMRQQLADSNQRLREHWGLDLSWWPSAARAAGSGGC
jgi:hypothetical protein